MTVVKDLLKLAAEVRVIDFLYESHSITKLVLEIFVLFSGSVPHINCLRIYDATLMLGSMRVFSSRYSDQEFM